MYFSHRMHWYVKTRVERCWLRLSRGHNGNTAGSHDQHLCTTSLPHLLPHPIRMALTREYFYPMRSNLCSCTCTPVHIGTAIGTFVLAVPGQNLAHHLTSYAYYSVDANSTMVPALIAFLWFVRSHLPSACHTHDLFRIHRICQYRPDS